MQRLWPRFWWASAGHAGLRGANQAGLVNNLNDGVAWGLLPLYYAAHALDARAACSHRRTQGMLRSGGRALVAGRSRDAP